MRSLLMSTQTYGELVKSVQEKTKRAKETVVNKVKFMTSDGGKRFSSGVDKILQMAAKLWIDIQYTQQTIEAGVDAVEWEWNCKEEFGQETHPPRNETVNLFPAFVVHEPFEIIYSGSAVWKDQEHVRNAENELKKFHNQRTFLNGKSHPRERRKRESISSTTSTGPLLGGRP
jgi:hypothetical protein